MKDTQRSEYVFTVQQRIAELAWKRPEECFTALNHYLTVDWLKVAYERVKPDSAPGVDGQIWAEYGKNLDENLRDLLKRAKSGSYTAPPVKRVHIPKGDGQETRAIGMPTIEDKVLQRAIVMLLEPIYEQDFKFFSYGFRPGRSAHEALSCIWNQCTRWGIRWILEVDIRKYFDTINKTCLRQFLDRRVRDGVVRRLIGKWLAAGVWEKGQLSYPEDGTPQGGVVSPLLSNVYLHEVMDCWYEQEVKPRMKGKTFLVRFADDLILGFENKEDAEKVYRVLFKRFEKYGLSLHPEKTRLVPFGRPEEATEPKPHGHKPGTFDFLGFTHYWAKNRKGQWIIRRKTMHKRLTRGLKAISQWCRKNRHEPMRTQTEVLGRKLKGHFGYYGITGNFASLQRFREGVIRIWRKWLARRGDPQGMPWARMNRLLQFFYIPEARVVHSIYAAKP
ncbi:group II intron reverse transcriptase/maturase [bacterium (Candidatus Blackallbacteria) CG18_big_fil_WC_8_21_14_2_50_49_26]|nr:MAG: group II intron reverse transcriptase/maturase [bacterium (Candidatus Blackallbacteria) CG18_big_fil_WC_8_21_14_2_50_49_26]